MGWVLNISDFLPCPGFCCGQLYLIRSSCHTLHTHLHFKYIPLFLSILLFIPPQHLHNFLPSLGSLGPTITVWLAAGPLTDLDHCWTAAVFLSGQPGVAIIQPACSIAAIITSYCSTRLASDSW